MILFLLPTHSTAAEYPSLEKAIPLVMASGNPWAVQREMTMRAGAISTSAEE